MSAEYLSELDALRYEIDVAGARPVQIDAHMTVLYGVGSDSFTGDVLSLLSDKAE